ncbi:AI-2E family transporter [bacterium]|nr:AI-2E family transporter [bacterium]
MMVLWPFIQSICLALLMSTVLAEAVEWFQHKCKLRRDLSAFLVSLAFSLGIILPLIILVIFVGRELIGVGRDVEEFLTSRDWLSFEFVEAIKSTVAGAGFDFQEKIGGIVSNIAQGAATFVGKIASSLPQLVLDLCIFVICLFYSLANKETLRELFADMLPLNQQEFSEFSEATVGVFKGVILGTLISGLVQGVIIGVGYWALGVPKPLLFGSVTAFLAFIPFLGTGPTGLGAIIYLIANDRLGAAMIMLIITAIAATSDNVVKPWVLKGSMEIHPLLSLLGALGGLAVFGFIGLFLGPLVVALAVISLKLFRESKTFLKA